jgi:SulP family sulfate permease
VVKHAFSGVDFRSRVNRSLEQRAILEAHGQQLYILELQGFIFFGTANSLYEQVKKRVLEQSQPHARFVVLDFSRVTGLDSTGLLSLIAGALTRDRHHLDFTGLNNTACATSIRDQLPGGFLNRPIRCAFSPISIMALSGAKTRSWRRAAEAEKSLADYFTSILPPNKWADHALLATARFATGDYLMRQGAESDDLFSSNPGGVARLKRPATLRLETSGGHGRRGLLPQRPPVGRRHRR